MRLGLMIATFVALSIAAVTGWTRHVSATTAAPVATPTGYTQTAAAPPANSTPCVEPAPAAQPYGQTYGASGTSPVYATLPYGESSSQTTFSGYAAQPVPPPPPPQYVANEQVIRHEYVAVPASRRVVYYRYGRVHHHRPFSHSVAIVAGTAAAGAGIGALAGGGRGAGIGALAGGAGGLIYDRLTH
jgi:hypothetical protein